MTFDRVFETFFDRQAFQAAPPPEGDGDPAADLPPEAEQSELAKMLMAGDASALAQAMEEAAERAQVSQIRLSTQRSRLTRKLLAPEGVWAAMKGKTPEAELAALPAGIAVFHVEPIAVPGLDAERCIVWMREAAGAAPGLVHS